MTSGQFAGWKIVLTYKLFGAFNCTFYKYRIFNSKFHKIVWVKSLLENAQTTISPAPQRFIWCYGQCQPSYFDMLRTIPEIEFNKGIPEDIDKVDYILIS